MEQHVNGVRQEEVVYKKRRQLPEVWRRFKKNRRAVFGGVLVLLLLLAGIFAPYLTPYDPYTQDLLNKNLGPSLLHLCGTDNFGRDIFTRILYGARISLIVGWVSVITACLLGGTLGAIAGYYGGKVDNIILRIMDIFLAIPSILLNISIVAALGGGLVNMLIAMGISSTPTYCRTIRAEILKVRNQEFVEASRAAGASDFTIILKHVIPNCLAPMIVRVTMSIGSAILSCASLSFIGLGEQPPTPSFGTMISEGSTYMPDYWWMTAFPALAIVFVILGFNFLGDGIRDMLASGRELIRTAPHICTFPGLAIMLTVFSLNLMGDGIRDAFDPKMKT